MENQNSKQNVEIEQHAQNLISQFDKTFDNLKTTTIFERLGKPAFIKINELNKADLEKTLHHLMKLMYNNQIIVDSISQITDIELYKFITEDILPHEIQDIWLEGLNLNFIYEEFHPNHQYSIHQNCQTFISAFLNKDAGFFSHFLTTSAQNDDWMYDFYVSYQDIELKNFNVNEIKINVNEAEVFFKINFLAPLENNNQGHEYDGEGRIFLNFTNQTWLINKIILPKFSEVELNQI